ncbi:MAG: hypothetical protein GX552_06240 [Chloroflexi bacterium]|nr:hypothetical protein [Chloroflexota bacterium]
MSIGDRRVWTRLPREEVIKAVEFQNPARIPLVNARWWGEGLHGQYGERLRDLDCYPEDAVTLWCSPFNAEKMGLSWDWRRGGAHDAHCVIDDWAKLDEFIAKLPDPEQDPQFDKLAEQAQRYHAEDCYILFGWWGLFFEQPWGIRGMQNLMMDYYTEPERVHQLHDALCNQYCGYIRRAIRELQPDGFWTSDDLGHQTQLMMNPAIFRSMIKPYYARVHKLLDEHGLHFWLHSCGKNTEVLDDLIEVGVDVFHPVQKGTMDELRVAQEFGGRIAFLAGIDVQHTLQEQDPDGVRAEVRFLIDTFDRPDGGLCLAAGNGIVAGTPFENIEAFLDEALRYGEQHRRRFL